MAIVHLFCKESNGLTLGPGDKYGPRVIQFTDHYAALDDTAPDFAEKMSWVNTPGCPPIEVVGTVIVEQKPAKYRRGVPPVFHTPTVADGWHQYQ